MWLCLWRQDVHPRVDQDAARDWSMRVSDFQRPRWRDSDESAKRLLCKREGDLDAQSPCQIQPGTVACACNPSTGEQTGRSLAWLDDQPEELLRARTMRDSRQKSVGG